MELDRHHDLLREDANRLLIDSIALLRNGRREEAIAKLEHRISRWPPSPGRAAISSICRGMILMIERRTDEAVDHLRESIRLYPHLAAPHVALSYTLLFDGQWDAAFAAYQAAIRIDSDDGKYSYPRVRDLYRPLVRAFEQAGRAEALFSAYTEVLFPDELSPLSPTTLPNPVEVFLDNQPSKGRYACLQVVREFIQGEPVYVLGRGGELEIPELITVCTFLSASAADLDLSLSVYSGNLLECGFGDRTIHRRLDIAEAFLKLCHELGYIKVGKSDADPPRWLTAQK